MSLSLVLRRGNMNPLSLVQEIFQDIGVGKVRKEKNRRLVKVPLISSRRVYDVLSKG